MTPTGASNPRSRLAGVAPLEASSGQNTRHRLNRALHTIAVTRSRYCPHTQAYIAKRTAEGKTPERPKAASNATSPARSTASSTTRNQHLTNIEASSTRRADEVNDEIYSTGAVSNDATDNTVC